MLYPQTNKARNIICLNDLWKFRLLRQESDFTPGMILEDDFEWIAVPASYNDQKEDPAYRRYAGLSVYQREVTLPAIFSGERSVLRFDAVANSAVIYLNGDEIGSHKGGYLPFEIELTPYLAAGETGLLTVLVDNRVNRSTLPVGNEKGTAFFGSDNAGIPSVEAGKDYQEAINLPNFDFFNYAGINRPVRIYTTPRTYIRDITLIPGIASDGTTGTLDYEVFTSASADDRDVCIRLEIHDASGEVVASAGGAKGSIAIADAKLWEPYPGTPYLYKACISFGCDYYEQTFGIRSAEARRVLRARKRARSVS